MPNIKVDLQSPEGLTYEGTLIPDDYKTDEILAETLEVLKLPLLSEDNRRINYSLFYVNRGVSLIGGQTLLEAGLTDGDVIRLIASQEISVDSNSSVDSTHLVRNRPSGASRSLRIFLCHSSTDKPIVRELFHRLRVDGFDPWLDEESLVPGQDWNEEIMKAVRTADVVMVCLTQKSINKSGYVQKEIKHALDIADQQPEGDIFLIPLKFEECDVPQRLSRWQWVNFFERRGYLRLLRALELKAGQIGLRVGLNR